jgi:hypothetical protein
MRRGFYDGWVHTHPSRVPTTSNTIVESEHNGHGRRYRHMSQTSQKAGRMNAAEIAALATAIPAICAAIVGLIAALRGNAKASAALTGLAGHINAHGRLTYLDAPPVEHYESGAGPKPLVPPENSPENLPPAS